LWTSRNPVKHSYLKRGPQGSLLRGAIIDGEVADWQFLQTLISLSHCS